MPHCLVEYTANISAEANIPELLAKIAGRYADSEGEFPVAGIRVRAIALTEYFVTDGNSDNAIGHATCTIAPARPESFRSRFFASMFETMKAHLAPLAETRFLGLSLDVVEGTEIEAYKQNF